jgi:hypothetical protein
MLQTIPWTSLFLPDVAEDAVLDEAVLLCFVSLTVSFLLLAGGCFECAAARLTDAFFIGLNLVGDVGSSLSLLWTGLKMLFVFCCFLWAAESWFFPWLADEFFVGAPFPRGVGFGTCLLLALITGVTVAVAFGFAGTFLCLVFVLGLPTDSSDSEEYAGLTGLDLLGFFSTSTLVFEVAFLLRAKLPFFGWGSESVDGALALLLTAAGLRTLGWDADEFSESDELESLPEDEDELDEDAELLLEEPDSELVAACKVGRTLL